MVAKWLAEQCSQQQQVDEGDFIQSDDLDESSLVIESLKIFSDSI